MKREVDIHPLRRAAPWVLTDHRGAAWRLSIRNKGESMPNEKPKQSPSNPPQKRPKQGGSEQQGEKKERAEENPRRDDRKIPPRGNAELSS